MAQPLPAQSRSDNKVPISPAAGRGPRGGWDGVAEGLLPRMANLGRTLAEQGVAAILLIPGSHPSESDLFCDRLARWLEQALHAPGRSAVPVHLVEWSGEAHHLGCTDGAVRLVDALLALELAPRQRVLLWGVGDAAHIFALASWLIAARSETAARVFQAARIYYRWPVFGCVDVPMWERVRRGLEDAHALASVLVDMVLWGPGARYPWRLDSRMRLLHFVHPASPDWNERPRPPERVAWRARLADRRLRRLFESRAFHTEEPAGPATIFESRIATVPPNVAAPSAALTGFADATFSGRRHWIVAQAAEVVRRFYGTRQLKVAKVA